MSAAAPYRTRTDETYRTAAPVRRATAGRTARHGVTALVGALALALLSGTAATANPANSPTRPGTEAQRPHAEQAPHTTSKPRIERASLTADGTEANDASWGAVISADGRYVAFISKATNLTPDPNNPYLPDTYVKDLRTGAVTFLRDGLGGVRISADGRCVGTNAFGAHDLQGFVHDLKAGTRQALGSARGGSQITGLSGDCRYAVYTANPLHPANPQRIYLHDRTTGQDTLVSRPPTSEQYDMSDGSLSADGRTLAYRAHRRLGDGPDRDDIIVTNLRTGEHRQLDGSQDDATAALVQLSANGRTVAYTVGLDTYVHDLRTGRTIRLNKIQGRALSPDGGHLLYTDGNTEALRLRNLRSGADHLVAAQGGAEPGALTAHARTTVFATPAGDLVPSDTNNAADVFVRRGR
ncbi:TolB-like translocation protein [Streptomyces rimosus]|uniref:PD40 domain-containing protein n=1 Tax=Streptomyces rimosus TaxID=1927 RepID=UPI0004C17459|nr:PD40 domain-containing protein [Streptomyces rimosus]